MSWLKRWGTWLNKHWDSIVAPATVTAAIGALCWVWIWSTFDMNEKVQMTTGVGTLALAVAAAVYGWHTRKQANASMKMAEATEKSIAETIRPMVLPSVEFGHSQDTESGQYHIDTMFAKFKNIGRGPALHMEAKIRHSEFKFEAPLPGTVLEVGQGFQLSIPHDGDPTIQKGFEIIVKYQSMYGKWFHSKLTTDEHGQHHLEYRELEGKGK